MVLIESGLIDSRPGGIAVRGEHLGSDGRQSRRKERERRTFPREIVHERERQMERGVRT